MLQFSQTARALLRKQPAHHEAKHGAAPPKPPLRNAPVRRASPYAPRKPRPQDLLR